MVASGGSAGPAGDIMIKQILKNLLTIHYTLLIIYYNYQQCITIINKYQQFIAENNNYKKGNPTTRRRRVASGTAVPSGGRRRFRRSPGRTARPLRRTAALGRAYKPP